MFPLVSLFNDISTFVGYLIPKLSLEKNRSWTIKLIYWEGDKRFHTFPKGISLKGIIIELQEFELTTISQSSTLATMQWGLPLSLE